jgi:hypothetical protein
MLKLISDVKELDKAITAWGQRGTKWATEGHMLAMSALTLTSKHNDVGPINRLYKAMPKGTKSSAMVSWLLAYGAVIANDDAATKADMPFKYTKDKAFKLDDAAKDPWFNHKPEPKADEVFDLAKAVEAVIKRAQGKQLVHGELLTGLQALVTMSHAGEVLTAGGDDSDDETPTGE